MASRAVAVALALSLAASTGGCVVGYVTVRPTPTPPAASGTAPPDWSGLRFTVHGWKQIPFQEGVDRDAPEAVLRVLRSRYGVLDARNVPREEGAFHIEITRKETSYSPLGGTLLGLSGLTFSIVPGYWTEVKPVTYALTPPGDATDGPRVELERSVTIESWLPFLLFAPDYFEVLYFPAWSKVELEGVEAELAVAEQALASFEKAIEAARGLASGGAAQEAP
jgi:hypothetical protein